MKFIVVAILNHKLELHLYLQEDRINLLLFHNILHQINLLLLQNNVLFVKMNKMKINNIVLVLNDFLFFFQIRIS